MTSAPVACSRTQMANAESASPSPSSPGNSVGATPGGDSVSGAEAASVRREGGEASLRRGGSGVGPSVREANGSAGDSAGAGGVMPAMSARTRRGETGGMVGGPAEVDPCADGGNVDERGTRGDTGASGML